MPKGAGNLGKAPKQFWESGGLSKAEKEERTERMSEPDRGQESQGRSRGWECQSFFRQTVDFAPEPAPTLAAPFCTHTPHQTITLDSEARYLFYVAKVKV